MLTASAIHVLIPGDDDIDLGPDDLAGLTAALQRVAASHDIDGTLIKTHDCLDGQTCVDIEDGAICALDDEPDAICEGVWSSVCTDTTTQSYCNLGFITGEQTCLECVPNAPGEPVTCVGGFGAECGRDRDCVSGNCGDGGLCLGEDN